MRLLHREVEFKFSSKRTGKIGKYKSLYSLIYIMPFLKREAYSEMKALLCREFSMIVQKSKVYVKSLLWPRFSNLMRARVASFMPKKNSG